MKAISFMLGAKTAMFKKPDVNSYTYFTYNNIHKPALLGLFGSIIGLGGYTQLFNKNKQIELENKSIKKKADKKSLDDCFPEFYEKLKDFKVSIRPLGRNGYFSKKIQVFNNSVGYASKELGGNLIVREQWLENPSWQIIILENNSAEFIKLKEYLLNQKSVFIPYLGKNDHPAKIEMVEEILLSDDLFEEEGWYIDSLFIKDCEIDGLEREGEPPFLFQEVSPIRLQKEYHFYESKTLCFTNYELEEFPKNTFSHNQKNYVFI